MKRRNRLCRAALVLALLVPAAIVTGVAASATTTAIPKHLTGKWERGQLLMVIGPRGKVKIDEIGVAHARFSHVTAHEKRGWEWQEWYGRLSISGIRSCSGPGRYRWMVGHGGLAPYRLSLKKIHDACKLRVNLLTNADSWSSA